MSSGKRARIAGVVLIGAALMLGSIHPLCEGAHAMPEDELSSLEWLLGTWQEESSRGITFETWTRVSPRTFEGVGEMQSAESGERVTTETLRIVEMSGDIFYMAYVSHNPNPVPFKLTQSSDRAAVFENPDHDFPTKLEYNLLAPDRLTVAVSNGERGFEISFTKAEAK